MFKVFGLYLRSGNVLINLNYLKSLTSPIDLGLIACTFKFLYIKGPFTESLNFARLIKLHVEAMMGLGSWYCFPQPIIGR